jgi:protoporphyrinogen oxidase
MKCEDISADWAAQRIKGLSLSSAVFNAIYPKKWRRSNRDVIKTLIDTFRYPRKGPGMLWDACAEKIRQQDNKVKLGSEVYHCEYRSETGLWDVRYRDTAGNTHSIFASQVISSAPLRDLALDYLSPSLSAIAIAAAKQLQYRDFLIVVLILKDKNLFQDNWIYVHDAQVQVARIQNFKSWSPDMVPEEGMCSYGMEYFCFKGDNIWSASDAELIQMATGEIVQLGLARKEDIVDGCVVRQPKAYPVYDKHYQDHVALIRAELEKTFPSLYLVGRNGMHKYNNQDHAMMTAMLTVKNILAARRKYNVWCVNQDAEYHESGSAGEARLEQGLRAVPERLD